MYRSSGISCVVRVVISGALFHCLLVNWPGIAAAQTTPRDLSDGQLILIHTSSLAVLAGGKVASIHPSGRLIDRTYRPNKLDLYVRRLIHGESGTSTNFIDRKFGGVMTPAACLAVVSFIDINRHEFSRDVPMYLAGLAATNGTTTIVKAIAKRPRPYCLPTGTPPARLPATASTHHRSFVSGHSSMAFYGATFLNLRTRKLMREEWTRDEYEVGRYLSPIAAYGWATLVGLSRIHADKHYFTDVLAGAILGTAVAELYYRMAYDNAKNVASGTGESLTVSLNWSF